MLTVAQVSDRLDMSKYSVYRLIHSGALPATRMRGGRHQILVDEAALAEFLNGADFIGVPVEPGPQPPLTVVEAAAALRCSPDTVRRMVGRGELRAFRNPGKNSHIRIPAEAIEEYMNRAAVGPRPSEPVVVA